MGTQQSLENERELLKLTDNFFVYKDDPFKILFYDKYKNNQLNWARYVKPEQVEKMFSTDEKNSLKVLRAIYNKHDLKTADGQKAMIDPLATLFPQLRNYLPDDDEIKDEPADKKENTNENQQQKQEPAQQSNDATKDAGQVDVMGRGAAFDEEKSMEIDKAEDALIVQQMQGIISQNPDNFFYELDIGGKKVIGLNVYGANEMIRFLGEKRASRRMPGYEVVKIDRGETDSKVWTETYIRDKLADVTLPAYVEQDKKMKKRDGSIVDDPHARGKSDSKSLRNAELKFIPTKDLIDFYKRWKQEQKGR